VSFVRDVVKGNVRLKQGTTKEKLAEANAALELVIKEASERDSLDREEIVHLQEAWELMRKVQKG
jgi:hypothetical protein